MVSKSRVILAGMGLLLAGCGVPAVGLTGAAADPPSVAAYHVQNVEAPATPRDGVTVEIASGSVIDSNLPESAL